MGKIEGTNKFIIYMYNGKNKRANSLSKPKYFVYEQTGTIQLVDGQTGKPIGRGETFNDYGKMISIINKTLRKQTRINLKAQGTWK